MFRSLYHNFCEIQADNILLAFVYYGKGILDYLWLKKFKNMFSMVVINLSVDDMYWNNDGPEADSILHTYHKISQNIEGCEISVWDLTMSYVKYVLGFWSRMSTRSAL